MIEIVGEDDAGRFKRVFVVAGNWQGKPLPFGRVAIAMHDGGWLGSSNGYPMGAPGALHPRAG